MRVRELLAVDIWNIHGGIEDTEIDSLLVALRHLIGLYTCRDFLLRDGDDRVNDELLSGIRPIDVCEVRQLYLSIGRIEKLIIDGGIAYFDSDEHTAHRCEDVEVTDVLKETCARRS